MVLYYYTVWSIYDKLIPALYRVLILIPAKCERHNENSYYIELVLCYVSGILGLIFHTVRFSHKKIINFKKDDLL